MNKKDTPSLTTFKTLEAAFQISEINANQILYSTKYSELILKIDKKGASLNRDKTCLGKYWTDKWK